MLNEEFMKMKNHGSSNLFFDNKDYFKSASVSGSYELSNPSAEPMEQQLVSLAIWDCCKRAAVDFCHSYILRCIIWEWGHSHLLFNELMLLLVWLMWNIKSLKSHHKDKALSYAI